MNPWDAVTWAASFALAASAVVIFGFFLRDARGILERGDGPADDEAESDDSSKTGPDS